MIAHRWMITGLMVAGMIAAMFSVRVPTAYACSCAEYQGADEEQFKREFERADAVFMGRALKDSDVETDDRDPYTATFKVMKVWKGPIQSIISIFNDYGGTCTTSITKGETY